jgi:hypothetical protein
VFAALTDGRTSSSRELSLAVVFENFVQPGGESAHMGFRVFLTPSQDDHFGQKLPLAKLFAALYRRRTLWQRMFNAE